MAPFFLNQTCQRTQVDFIWFLNRQQEDPRFLRWDRSGRCLLRIIGMPLSPKKGPAPARDGRRRDLVPGEYFHGEAEEHHDRRDWISD